MSKLIIKAQYAQLIAGFQSTEVTCRSLNGFYTENHPQQGVLLVATDRHRMGVFHDSEGTLEGEPQIWNLPKETLKACRYNGRDAGGLARWFVVRPVKDGGEAHAFSVVLADSAQSADNVANSADSELIITQGLIAPIDGTLPAWRRVVPPKDKIKPHPAQGFNANLLAPFAAVAGTETDGHRTHGAYLEMHATGNGAPFIVLTGRPDFLGVIMPMRGCSLYPDWLAS